MLEAYMNAKTPDINGNVDGRIVFGVPGPQGPKGDTGEPGPQGPKGDTGEVDEAAVQQIVSQYLDENPPSVTETDPTVPAWAKQPEKPTYTAAEVGALPATYTLPIATETTLGGVKPVTATDAMTQSVGVTEDGRLVTKPGEGGSGIAVTGATVGQTVKISAVDDDGVPTAWEAVDLPSGGGKWRKIADLTITEDAKEILISQDMNGKPFALKEVRIATCAAAVAAGTGYDYCVMEVNGSSIVVGQNNGINTNRYYRYAYFSVAPDGTGFGWFTSINVPIGANSNFNSLSTPNGSNGLKPTNYGFPITSVGFRHNAAAGLIAAGAEMVVYGIDA